MKIKTNLNLVTWLIMSVLFVTSCKNNSDYYTRGVGKYPGDPKEDFSPEMVPGSGKYRNIARLRPAYQSSSYDYNLTAQLATDGIITHEMPDYISLSTGSGITPNNEREWLFDHNTVTEARFTGRDIWLVLGLHEEKVPQITKININGSLAFTGKPDGGWHFTCFGSDDGSNWNLIGNNEGNTLPGNEIQNPFAAILARPKGKKTVNPYANFFAGPYGSDSAAPKPSFSFNFGIPKTQRSLNLSFEFKEPVAYHYYRLALQANCAEEWRFGEWSFYSGDKKLKVAPSHRFRSAWMSETSKNEWLYVDLGKPCVFDKIKLYWVNKPSKGAVQVSDNARQWNDIAPLPENEGPIDSIVLKTQAKGRYVRVSMNSNPAAKNFILSELEIYGKGGLVPKQKPEPDVSENCMNLSGGNWKIQRDSEVSATGETISRPGFQNDDWVVGTVPGTVLVSYWNAGALPDPGFGDNQLLISESFFNSNFWYRNEFKVPASFKSEKMFLNFDGINWKADIYVNGSNAGHIDGAFIRGKFDVTELVKPGEINAIAVLIKKNDNIGVVKQATASDHDKNGGILGADNPTYHASIGWDWIPTIRGRNIGIWNDVRLTTAGSVTIEDPVITTDLALPDTSAAEISVEATLHNYKTEEVIGHFTLNYGDIAIDKEVVIGPASTKTIILNSVTNKELLVLNPKLWWPKGYGEPYLYDVKMSFITNNVTSDTKEFKSGIRDMTFDETNGILNIYINGRRFIGRGGNWGFPESNLKYRGREYDIAVGYHADMNFNMIRNWVGQTGDDEFYEACDRHGIMVWQDFWLANPADGPDPDDSRMFMDNAIDLIKRIRNHPSIAIYVGRNEGNPPVAIDTALRVAIKELHPDLHYIPNSAFGVVSGGGPYRALPVRDYFLLYGFNRFHSERGMPNVMTYESLVQTLPDSLLWPQNSQWGLHDYCLESAQSAASFNQMIETGFGKTDNARRFTELAQWINYNGYRGMFEGRSLYRQGLLLWMSHPAWPSMVWQTYDYYLEPTAAYFGCKKASEPIHIQWNPVFDNIEVVNYNAKNRTGLKAKAVIMNMDGSVQWEKEKDLDCKEDSTAICFKLEFPKSLSPVHYIRLTLKQGDKLLSDNFYLRGLTDGNYQALNELPSIKLSNETKIEKSGDKWVITTTLSNNTKTPALMIRLKVVGKDSGNRILPVFYGDNYFSLMPGESKVITMALKDEDTRGEKPAVNISGFNLEHD